MLFNKHQKNDIALMKAVKEFREGTLILGNGVTHFFAIECENCNFKFNEFNFTYLKSLKGYFPCCPNCNADITQNTFIPLDVNLKRLE